MENYGLVTYWETALLYDDQHSAAANKQRVAIVVAHELAHQWFGKFCYNGAASRSVHRTRPIKRNTLKLSNRDVPENNPSYTTVYVGNLPHDVTQVELHCPFHALGAGVLEEVRVQRDKGFGFVGYNTHEEAALVTQMANGRPVQGKTMKCSWGSKPTPPGTASNPLPPHRLAEIRRLCEDYKRKRTIAKLHTNHPLLSDVYELCKTVFASHSSWN
ncbi:hypothetical protein KIW84_041371 [Lathyrus oleraceus]|uniref:RRM domain-containing protein n=1 Tax=Pisum sativum TaxID=3888 RepID=A0A9D4XBC3_PEA|nr:hypothetical protein KIW84_041371 [Pisum sativum]